jgi:hypothetical protein
MILEQWKAPLCHYICDGCVSERASKVTAERSSSSSFYEKKNNVLVGGIYRTVMDGNVATTWKGKRTAPRTKSV